MESRVLILNSSYVPHSVINWIEAVGLIFTGKVEVIETYHDSIGDISSDRVCEFPNVLKSYHSHHHKGDFKIMSPAVIRLKKAWDQKVRRNVKFSRHNVYTRDGFKCQYCGEKFRPHQLNYDHVIPRSKGGKTCWENIVTSCYPCNERKAGRTPEEAEMKLKNSPKKPKHLPSSFSWLDVDNAHEIWKPYIPNNEEIR